MKLMYSGSDTVMIIQVFYICASDQYLKILLYNTVETKVRVRQIKYEQ